MESMSFALMMYTVELKDILEGFLAKEKELNYQWSILRIPMKLEMLLSQTLGSYGLKHPQTQLWKSSISKL